MEFLAERYYRNIHSKLAYIHTCIVLDNQQNIQIENVISEGFFAQFLNTLYGWKLVNDNTNKQNVKGYDLRDDAAKIIVQVSSTYDHGKIQGSLTKSDTAVNAGYHFYFLAITEKTQKYDDFQVPKNLVFSKQTDILSIGSLLKKVLGAPIDRQKALSELMDRHFGEALQMPRELSQMPGYADETTVLHREEDVGRVIDMVKDGKNILLSGFGGIGKTALAKLLLFRLRAFYDDVAWIPYNGSLKRSLLASIRGLGNFRTEDENWNAILALQNNGRKKLFVIDNADHDEKTAQNPAEDTELSAITGWSNTTVIVTSRLNELPGYRMYDVGFLDKAACMDIFYSYYQNDPERKHLDVVSELVRCALYHTFTVELLAKAANRETNLQAYCEKVKDSFKKPKHKFTVAHHPDRKTVSEHLQALFDMQQRSDTEKSVLQTFSALPSGAALSSEEAGRWFGLDIDVADCLVDYGWLSWTENGYAIHPLVQEIILFSPLPEDTCAQFLSFIEDYHNGYFSRADEYPQTIRKIETVEAVLQNITTDKATLQFGDIYHNLASAYDDMGSFDQALTFYQKALKIKEAKLGTDHPSTAATYNNMALVYKAKGDLDKALEFYQKDLKISEAKLGTDHPDTATTYNNMAVVYRAKGDLDKALEFYQKALDIVKAKLGTDHPSTATTYNNMASVYYDKGDLDKALEFFQKASKIYEAKLGTDHPSTAITYTNIGALQYQTGDYQKGLENLLRAFLVFVRKLGLEHPYTETAFSWLPDCFNAAHPDGEPFEDWLFKQLAASVDE